ncbi:MAG: hypothetical protein AXA67_12675 [Methylothermaceae bacteria B42]|nr:MAG: hypothetical protein AXA67_12675 [Methylothermaceae bacteria B42]
MVRSYDIEVNDARPISINALTDRDRLQEEWEQLTPSERKEVFIIDEILLDEALNYADENIEPQVMEDHPDKPLEHWWWHLGDIVHGEYQGQLPDYLASMIENGK